MHKQVIAALADVMMFDPSMAFPTIIPKKLKELSFYDDEIILATIEQCRDKIGYAMRTKEFFKRVRPRRLCHGHYQKPYQRCL